MALVAWTRSGVSWLERSGNRRGRPRSASTCCWALRCPLVTPARHDSASATSVGSSLPCGATRRQRSANRGRVGEGGQ